MISTIEFSREMMVELASRALSATQPAAPSLPVDVVALTMDNAGRAEIAYADPLYAAWEAIKRDPRLRSTLDKLSVADIHGIMKHVGDALAPFAELVAGESPTLEERLRTAAKHKMTPDEVRAQKLSFVAGQLGVSREQVIAILPELASPAAVAEQTDREG